MDDFVSHIDHGVGQFSGLHKIENNGKKQEVIKLIYKAVEISFISVFMPCIKLLNFQAKEGHQPKIHQLGSPQWIKTKNKTKVKVKQIALI